MISGSIVVELARGRLPAIPPGGMCVVDVEAVVQGHLAAAERGRRGERYILGGENLSHRQIAETVARIVGRRAPRLNAPGWLLGPLAAGVDLFNRIKPGQPQVSGDQIRLGAVNFFFNSRKAQAELGLPLLPVQHAAEQAYRWYCDHGYLP